MLIVDDIALFPVRSMLWVFRELYNAAQQELAGEADSITAELSELYKMVETGAITEDEFEAREKELLDRLEEIEERTTHTEEDEEAVKQDHVESVVTELSPSAAMKADLRPAQETPSVNR